jgi:hypothetical protein
MPTRARVIGWSLGSALLAFLGTYVSAMTYQRASEPLASVDARAWEPFFGVLWGLVAAAVGLIGGAAYGAAPNRRVVRPVPDRRLPVGGPGRDGPATSIGVGE